MSEGSSWKTPAAVIGIITVLITGVGVYISKRSADLDAQKQQYQQSTDAANKADQDKKDAEKQRRIAELNNQLTAASNQVKSADAKIQETYRQIQDYDFKQNDATENAPARAADHQSYLIAKENLDIFSKSKQQYQDQVDALRKEIDDLTK